MQGKAQVHAGLLRIRLRELVTGSLPAYQVSIPAKGSGLASVPE